ncbi:MAG: hypothetical protein JWQ25_1519 [Daejeonella sp.]|nr:hypothetical protein [Daejeonella sp.]
MMDSTFVHQTVTSWTEDKSTLNSHQEGTGAFTLDVIYDAAKTNWLKADRSKNDVYFEAKNDGLISRCGYSPHGCADDCFFGVTITEIKAGLIVVH